MPIDKTKPRVAVYYDVLASTGFRDDGCPLFLNWNLRKILNGNTNLEDHSGNVVHLSPYNSLEGFGNFDLNVLVDYGEDALGIPLNWKIPHPNAYWISDAHLGYAYRLKRAKEFDHVFVAQKWFIDKMVADGVPRETLHYLPHAYAPEVYKPLPAIKKWDWTFIGYPNSEHRVALLDQFIKEFPNYYLGWRMGAGHNELEDCNEKYNQSKIVINDAVLNDVNMRIFESLGSGACLLTKDIPEVRGLFNNGEHLYTYSTIGEAVKIARSLIRSDEMRKIVATNGNSEVRHKHTYYHRAQEMLDVCLGYKTEKELHATTAPC